MTMDHSTLTDTRCAVHIVSKRHKIYPDLPATVFALGSFIFPRPPFCLLELPCPGDSRRVISFAAESESERERTAADKALASSFILRV